MKITFVTGNWLNLSGGIRVIAIYADGLQKRGHEVFVVCPKPPQPSFKQQIKSFLKGKGWIAQPTEKPSHFDGLDIPRQVLPHGSPITDQDLRDADVVIATWWETAEWVAKLSPSKGAKAYFIQHHEVHDYIPKERAKATYRLPLHKITIAQWLVDLMKIEYGDNQVSLVPNSVDTKLFYSASRQKQSIPTVGLMYSTVYWKGCDIIFQAISLARQHLPQLKVIAFGRHQPSPSLQLPEGTKYFYQPNQDTIRDIYSACDAWLFGSLREGFGLPILEAMACGTPVIGTPVGAAPELLAKGGGILVKPEDPEDMADAIIKLCQVSDQQWKLMSDMAYQTATSYSWNDATDLFEAAIYTAIERTKSGNLTS